MCVRVNAKIVFFRDKGCIIAQSLGFRTNSMFRVTHAAATQVKVAGQQGGTDGMPLRLAAQQKPDGSIDYLGRTIFHRFLCKVL